MWALGPPSGAGKLRGRFLWAGLMASFHPCTSLGVSAVVFHSTASRFGMDASRQETFLCSWFSVSDVGASLWKSGFQPQSCEVDQERARVEISLCPGLGNGSFSIMFRACSLGLWLLGIARDRSLGLPWLLVLPECMWSVDPKDTTGLRIDGVTPW